MLFYWEKLITNFLLNFQVFLLKKETIYIIINQKNFENLNCFYRARKNQYVLKIVSHIKCPFKCSVKILSFYIIPFQINWKIKFNFLIFSVFCQLFQNKNICLKMISKRTFQIAQLRSIVYQKMYVYNIQLILLNLLLEIVLRDIKK